VHPVTLDNHTHVCMTLMTGNDLRNKILHQWYKVTEHPAHISPRFALLSFHCSSYPNWWQFLQKCISTILQ
jgi:hypothetical protein